MILEMKPDITVIQPPPYKLEEIQNKILSPEAKKFIYVIFTKFEERINKLYSHRLKRKQFYSNKKNKLPSIEYTPERIDKSWKINTIPPRLRCRHIDIGDVSPANTAHFVDSLKSGAQGVQVDFDDGHCPTWRNQIQGYYNVMQAIDGKLAGAPQSIQTCPVLMLRPRAWNIIEHNILVNGKEIPGAVLDFAILMFHCGRKLYETGCGPFFYLSKIECSSEAQLWNDIFIWTQLKLNIPRGTIKACVLIENIISAFQTVEILYALREHSLGLNCGIWDYIASIVCKFANRKEFVLPDRRKHVSAENNFIKTYQLMIIKDCHERGAPATAGMAAQILQPSMEITSKQNMGIINKVIEAKYKEIAVGFDGFLIYDIRIVPYMNELWVKQCATLPNQHEIIPKADLINYRHLLEIPQGKNYMDGLKHNIAVSILFVYYWLAGVGHFFYAGLVEDSATTEISRFQVWQCIHHQVALDDGTQTTYKLVEKIASEFTLAAHKELCRSNAEKKRMNAAKYVCLELFVARDPPDFVTSYLNDSHKFRTIHNKALSVKSNL